jgi:4-hydroxy-3-methylbut-2-enyl diphosphate reductase IspH
MKTVTREATIRNEGASELLGTYQVTEFDTVEEAVEKFGSAVVVGMINSSYGNDVARVARNAFQKEEEVDVQAEIDAYVPGQRKSKPSMAKLMALVGELAAEGKADIVAQVVTLQATEGIEAAYNFALENK